LSLVAHYFAPQPAAAATIAQIAFPIDCQTKPTAQMLVIGPLMLKSPIQKGFDVSQKCAPFSSPKTRAARVRRMRIEMLLRVVSANGDVYFALCTLRLYLVNSFKFSLQNMTHVFSDHQCFKLIFKQMMTHVFCESRC
jgi:hypothetical protein